RREQAPRRRPDQGAVLSSFRSARTAVRLAPAGLGRPSRRAPGAMRPRAVPGWLGAAVRSELAPAIPPSRFSRSAFGRFDADILLLAVRGGGADDRSLEARGDRPRHLEEALLGADPDCADLVAGDVSASAQIGQDPARI